MKKLKHILILISIYSISYSFPTLADTHTEYILTMIKQINALKSVDDHPQQEVDSLVNELSEYMHNQNYDSLKILYNAGMLGNNTFDVQFNKALTASDVRNYILPNGDTNSVLIVWKDGLPKNGIKFNGMYQNNPNITNYIDYTDSSANRAEIISLEPPIFSDNLIKFRNVDSWQVKIIDICSGNTSIEETLPASANYFVDSIDVGFTYSVLNSDEPDRVIDISNLPNSLYFVMITNLTDNKVIYIKTLNRGFTIFN